jgi:hypothetical protein
LMTDVYPPFRLDSGGNEPGSAMTMQSYGSSSPAAGPVSGPSDAGISGADSGKTGWTSGPVISLVAGSLFGLMSFGVLAAAVVVFSVDGNREDGFVTTPSADFSTEAYAVVAEGLEVYLEGTDRVVPEAIIGDVRVDITGAEKPVFVGIARSSDVDRYLSGVSYSEVPDLSREDGRNLPATAGGGPSASPASQPFWAASSEGPGSREIRWPVENGTWSVVIMNADASPGLEFRGDIGAEVPILRPIYIGLFIVGNVLLVAAIVLIVAAVRRAGRKSSWVGP